MKYWFIKVFLLIVIFFFSALFEGIVLNRGFKPYLEHYTFLEKTEKNYIQKEKGPNSLFLEISNNRIHSTLHKSEEELFDCEENADTICFISAISCLYNEDDYSFWSKFLLKGNLPSNNSEIVINEELSKRKNIKIDDIVSVKSPLFYKTVRISGILMNTYGFSTFERENSYYILSRITDDYISKIRGSWFCFSDSKVNDFGLENIKDSLVQFKRVKLRLCLIILILKIMLNTVILFSFQKTLTLRQFYNSLLAAGYKKKYIKNKILLFEIFFVIISTLISLLFSQQTLFISIDFGAVILVAVINFLFLRRKTYGFN